jgi:ArsR family transcriptional regulator
LRPDIDECQHRWVSNSLDLIAPPRGVLPLADDPLASCTPLSREPLGPDAAAAVVPMLKAIADPARLRLLSLVLSHEGAEACVCDLLPHFELSQPTISHHLKVLHDAGLLDRTKRGVWVYYAVRREVLTDVATLIGGSA